MVYPHDRFDGYMGGVIYLIGVEFGVARFDIDGLISGRPRIVKRVTDELHALYLYAVGFLIEFRC